MVNNDTLITQYDVEVAILKREIMALHYDIKVKEEKLKEIKEMRERMTLNWWDEQ